MPAAEFNVAKFGKGRKFSDRFKKGKLRRTGAPRKFTGPGGNVAGAKGPRRMQKHTRSPKDMKGSAMPAGKKKMASHSMGGMFGVSPKKTEPDNRPPHQSEKRADLSARAKRLRNLLI